MTQQARPSITPPPPLTEEEQQRMRAALERARVFREKLLTARNGKLFPPAADDLAATREEWDEHLP
jgi:hypothetical protein